MRKNIIHLETNPIIFFSKRKKSMYYYLTFPLIMLKYPSLHSSQFLPKTLSLQEQSPVNPLQIGREVSLSKLVPNG